MLGTASSLSSSSSTGAGMPRKIQILRLQGTSCNGKRQRETGLQTVSTLCGFGGRKQVQGAMGEERKRCLSLPAGVMKRNSLNTDPS